MISSPWAPASATFVSGTKLHGGPLVNWISSHLSLLWKVSGQEQEIFRMARLGVRSRQISTAHVQIPYLWVPVPITALPSGLEITSTTYSQVRPSLRSPNWIGAGSSTPTSGLVTISYKENFSSCDKAKMSVSFKKPAQCMEAPWLTVWWRASSSSEIRVS